MKPLYTNALSDFICAFVLIVESQSAALNPRCVFTQMVSALKQVIQIGSSKLPDTPAGKTLGDFIKAFNTGDLETLKRFHKERGGDEENAQQDIGFYQESGGLEVYSVTRSEQYEIEVLV